MERNHMLPPLLEPARDPQSLAQRPPPYDSPSSASPATASKTYSFPEPPDTALPPIQPAHHDHEHSLPSLSSVTAGAPLYRDKPQMSPPPASATTAASPSMNHWPSMNPLTQFYTPSHLQQPSKPAQSPPNMDLDPASPRYVSRGNSVSLDDPDVRMAAEALGDLRADFLSSPPTRATTLPSSPATPMTPKRVQSSQHQPEPLLSLLTTASPVLGNTIESATSAYASGKNFSPRFKTGAEYVEGYVTPVANTVGSIGRVTGIEGGVRWFLKGKIRKYKARKQHDLGKGDSHKRRKVGIENGGGNTAAETGQNGARQGPTDAQDQDAYDRRLSVGTVETLPAYDDARSPAYAETEGAGRNPAQQPWQSRLIMSTSGLSIAMSEESLRSLKYCLQWLRWANSHIARMITALKEALEQYDNVQLPRTENERIKTNESQLEARSKIIERISTLKSDVLKTLQDVIRTVSTYAGGALPDNARDLVRRQLTSLPQRFRLAQSMEQEQEQEQEGTSNESENTPDQSVRDGAQKVLVLAKEGLDMMVQISGVVDGTIVSAEEWCERLGKKRRASNEGGRAERPVVFADEKKPVLDSDAPVNGNSDVTMQGT